MKRNLFGLAWLCCLLLLPAAVRAEGSLDERISLKVDKADPQEVLQTFGKLMSLPTEIDPAIEKRLSLQVEQVTIRTALNAVCESVGCQWQIEGGKLLKVSRLPEAVENPGGKGVAALQERIDVKVTAADARNLFAAVAQIMSGELSMDSGVRGKLNLDIKDRPLAEILDTACAQIRCRWRVTGSGKPVLEIKPK